MGVEVTFTHVQAHIPLRTKWNKPNQCNKSWSHMLIMAHPHIEGCWFINKAFVCILTNCGKLLKRWGYQAILPVSWEICMQVRKQQLELDMEQQIGSK